MYETILQIYKSDNTAAKVVLSFLFGIIFVLTSAVCFFTCYDTTPSRPSKRLSSKRESTASQRQSTSTEESRLSASGEGNVKKRSTARRRD
jgi:hypothetical protein